MSGIRIAKPQNMCQCIEFKNWFWCRGWFSFPLLRWHSRDFTLCGLCKRADKQNLNSKVNKLRHSEKYNFEKSLSEIDLFAPQSCVHRRCAHRYFPIYPIKGSHRESKTLLSDLTLNKCLEKNIYQIRPLWNLAISLLRLSPQYFPQVPFISYNCQLSYIIKKRILEWRSKGILE